MLNYGNFKYNKQISQLVYEYKYLHFKAYFKKKNYLRMI